MSIDELLKIIQKTNPTMTKELLIYELSQCRYSSKAFKCAVSNTPVICNFVFKNP